jgi:hypothetical protein
MKHDRIPTPDGGQEVISARFVRPGDALAEFRERKVTLMPPQFYILTTLFEILHGQKNTPQQREQIRTLSQGSFGHMVFNPILTKDVDGREIFTYEGDETRGGSKGRLHRASGILDRTGVSTSGWYRARSLTPLQIPIELRLIRNFDIFTELQPTSFGSSKL